MKVASIGEIREIEAAADRAVMSYAEMMRAAGAAASVSLQRRRPIDETTRIAFLIGKGNNGGDGLVMARDLALSTAAEVSLFFQAPRDPADVLFRNALELGLPMLVAEEDRDWLGLERLIKDADIVVDALLGIGARPPLRGLAASLLKRARDRLLQLASPRPYVFALDCPSGIDCDNGRADARVIAADATIAFITAKPGHFVFPAAGYVGDLEVATLGIPGSLPALDRVKATVLDERLAASLLPARPLDGHKGTFGKVLIVAGSPAYIGAIALAGEAAYRSGAGLATVATAKDLTRLVAPALREATWLPLPDVDGVIAEGAAETALEQAAGYDAMLVGCGLGTRASVARFTRRLLLSENLPPLILDADALNLLSRERQWWTRLPAGAILTPHPGELARLTGLSAKAINADRWAVARRFAQAWQVTLLLKGAHTIVAAPDGRASVLPFKTDALSTAGAGDVLAGLIAGLRAQGLGAYDSARLGAYVHAAAGLLAAEKLGSSRSVIAGDMLTTMGWAFADLERL